MDASLSQGYPIGTPVCLKGRLELFCLRKNAVKWLPWRQIVSLLQQDHHRMFPSQLEMFFKSNKPVSNSYC